MKRPSLEATIAGLLLIIFVGLVIHTPVTVWMVAHGAPVWVKAWKEILLGLAALLTAIAYYRQAKRLTRSLLGILIAAYVGLHVVALLWSSGGLQSEVMGLVIDLRYVVYFATIFVFLYLYPRYRQQFLRAGIVGACIALGFVLLQQLLPHDALATIGYSKSTIQPYLLLDENPAYVRMNGTMRGPNPLGAYAMMVLLMLAAYGMKYRNRHIVEQKQRWVFVLLLVGSLTALWVSYSRSAVIGLAAGLVVLVLAQLGHQITKRQIAAIALMTMSLGLIVYGVRDTAFFHNVILHDNPTSGAVVTSNEGHASSLAQGVRDALAQPFGMGIGSTGSASLGTDQPLVIENQYLMIVHEVGWIGLALFIAIWLIVLRCLWRRRQDWWAAATAASGVGLMAIGLLWPVLSDDPVSMLWWGMAAVCLTAKGERHGTTTNKKTA